MSRRGAILLLIVSLAMVGATPSDHEREIDTWHAHRIDRLTGPTGWLSLVGLLWLQDGQSCLGSDPSAEVPLPPGKAPARAGTITVVGTHATLEVNPGVPLLANGEPVSRIGLANDAAGEPTVLTLGPLTFYVIERGGRLAIRLKDAESEARTSFAGIDRYPVDPTWRVTARLEAPDGGSTLRMPNVLGQVEEVPLAGRLVFERDGVGFGVDVAEEGDKLFLVFADATSGRETYGGGRFIYVERPDAAGNVTVDFNRAYNPPCVFTPYATCPLPPSQNRLPIAVRAGEKIFVGAHER